MKKKVVRNLTALSLSALLLAATATGCGETGTTTDQEGSSKTESKKDVTLTVASVTDWVTDTDKELSAKFTEETGIKMDYQLAIPDQYSSLLKTKFASGSGPDIFWYWSGANAEQMLPEKNFLDLSNEEWVSRLRPEAIEGISYNGKVGAFNCSALSQGWGIWYNKKIFSENNVTVPKTFEEFTNVCETLKNNGVQPIYLSMKDEWSVGIWLSQLGPVAEKSHDDFYKKLNNNEIKFAEVEEFKTFLEQYKTLYDNGYFGEDPLSDTWDQFLTVMNDGEAAMVMTADAAWVGNDQFAQSVSDYGMFPIPMAGNKYLAMTSGGIARYANKNSQYVDEIKEYFNFLAEKENLDFYYEGQPGMAVYPTFKDYPIQLDETSQDFTKNAEGGQGLAMEYYCSFWDSTAVGRYIQEMFLGKKTATQVLETIDADREKLFNSLEE